MYRVQTDIGAQTTRLVNRSLMFGVITTVVILIGTAILIFAVFNKTDSAVDRAFDRSEQAIERSLERVPATPASGAE